MKTMTGIVVSAKLPKTVTVKVDTRRAHPLYQKMVLESSKFLCHDEKGAKEGDTVTIRETRPLSAHKHFEVIEVVQKENA